MRFLYLLSLVLFTACGGPRHESNFDPNMKFSEQELTFANIKKEVLTPYCINCHLPIDYHIDYQNYARVKTQVDVMLERMKSPSPNRRMPKGGILPPRLISLFEAWIESGAPERIDKQNPQPIESDLDFTLIRNEVLEPNKCLACHTEYSNEVIVKRNLGAIIGQIEKGLMPKARKKGEIALKVSNDDLDLLNAWNEIVARQPRPEMQPLEPTFNSLRDHVFGPKCIVCHNSYGSRAKNPGQSFGFYSELRNWANKEPDLFSLDESQKASGLFLESILRDPDDIFLTESPMPFNNPSDDIPVEFERLSDKEIETIRQWIQNGLPQGDELK